MKTLEFVIQRYESVQDKWYPLITVEKLKLAKLNLQSLKETHTIGKYRIIKRTISEKTIK